MQAASLALALLLGSEPETVLYDFGGPNCIYCQQMNPLVDRLIEEGHPIVKVNCDQNRELARQYNVRDLPTFVLVINGREVDRSVGGPTNTPESRLRQMLARIPEANPEVQSPPAAGATRQSPSSAAPPSSGHVVLGESGPFPGSQTQPPAQSNQPRPEASTPPIPPAQGVARDRTESPSMQFGLPPQQQNQPLARGNDEGAAAAEPAAVSGSASMAASVRIRVIHNGRVNLGSGTLVISQQGRSLVMTCGHIFRDIGSTAKIEVDVFINGELLTYVGTLTDYDLEAEIGLITVPSDRILPVAKIAPMNRVQAVHDRVASIGCSGGDNPSREQHQITAVNKYEGPDNLECNGTPVQGRSGGGLFNTQEELVGVCFSAGVDEPLGLYAGPSAMYAMLDKIGLAALYTPDATQPAPTVGQPSQQIATGSTVADPFARGGAQGNAVPPISLGQPSNQPLQPFTATQGVRTPETSGSGPFASTTEPLDFETGDAEVVCLITQSDGSRRVVVLHRASPKFVAYLNGELDASESITLLEDETTEGNSIDLTAQRVPRPESIPVMTFAYSTPEPAPRAYTTENFQPTSLVQPMLPRAYVRQR